MKTFITSFSIFLFLIILNLHLAFVIETKKHADLNAYFFAHKELSDDYTKEEKIHLSDIKNIISKTVWVEIFLGLLILSGFLILKTKKYILRAFRLSGFLLILWCLLLLTGYFINFEKIFDLFHELLFKNNYWILPGSTKLIQDFPYAFFQKQAIILWCCFLLEGILLCIACKDSLFCNRSR